MAATLTDPGFAPTRNGGGWPAAEEVNARRTLDLISGIQSWTDARGDKVESCYLAVGPGGFELTVVGTTAEFDFDLNEKAAGLAIHLTRQGVPLSAVVFGTGTANLPAGPGVVRIRPS